LWEDDGAYGRERPRGGKRVTRPRRRKIPWKVVKSQEKSFPGCRKGITYLEKRGLETTGWKTCTGDTANGRRKGESFRLGAAGGGSLGGKSPFLVLADLYQDKKTLGMGKKANIVSRTPAISLIRSPASCRGGSFAEINIFSQKRGGDGLRAKELQASYRSMYKRMYISWSRRSLSKQNPLGGGGGGG